MGTGPDKETLRNDTVQLIKDRRDAHQQWWEYRLNDVVAASDVVVNKRLELLEERVRKLATSDYPLLWEALISILLTVIPVARIVQGLTNQFARSFKLGRLMPEAQFVRGQGRLPADMGTGKVFVPSSDVMWIREVVEYDAAIVKFASVYNSEIAATLRSQLRSAIDPLLKQPVVSQDELFSKKSSKQDTKGAKGSVGAPALLKGIRDWISATKIADLRMLDDLLEVVRAADDVDTIKTFQEYLAEDPETKVGQEEAFDREAFQRYVEMCIWCTTWDFMPKFVRGGRGRTIATAGYQPTRFELPPFGDDFWNYACDRYLDPFFDAGDKTYNEVGVHQWLAPSESYNAPLELAEYLEGGGMTPPAPAGESTSGRGSGFAQAEQKKGFYPAERLAFQWSFIIAPDLFNANRDIAEQLASKVGMETE